MKNRILQLLPARDYRALAPHIRSVELKKGATLFEPGQRLPQIYFLESGLVSFFSETADGETIEVSIVGNEGVVGVGAAFGERSMFRAVVQIGGEALTISNDIIHREFARGEALQRAFMLYTHALLIQIAQTAVCNKFHSIEERLCRWLLVARDRTGSDSFPLTQDVIARILGSRRASVTVIAGQLQKTGIIRCNRGHITIKDRKRLQNVACECYENIAAAYLKISS